MEEFNKGVVYNVVTGHRIIFWLDPWLVEETLCSKFPNLFVVANSQDMYIHEVASQSVDNWNLTFKRRLYDHEVREAAMLMDLLENFKFADGEEDSRNWKWSKNGEFSVRSMYNASLNFHDVGMDKQIWSTLWPARVSFLMWIVSNRNFLTHYMLQRRGQIIASRCNLCYAASESIEHLLCTCPFVWRIWNSFLEDAGVSTVLQGSVIELLDGWYKKFDSRQAKLVWKMIPVEIMWAVWKEQNKRIFEERKQCWSRVLNSVKVLIYSWGKLHEEFKVVTLDYMMGHWKEFIFDPP
ncbi:Reverse transcriptase zinc-binding domain [Macleaya cordata]|uniref:Reverse transcriptase zinc-binding domain n=1 Tax=Macleaya cordata TaxID=56857 RepID=A0A200R8K6_MACCD|nr:Reverse transcriptase zinc-binding domain [Macleaya cordata]